GTGQRAVPLLRRASIALRVAQRRRRVRPNSDLVTNRLTIRVNLVTNLSDLTRGNIGTDELVTIHHVENERLTAARVRRNNHQRTISVNLRAVIQLDSLSLRLNQSERVSQVRLSDNLTNHLSVLPSTNRLTRPLARLSDAALRHVPNIGPMPVSVALDRGSLHSVGHHERTRDSNPHVRGIQ